MSASDAWLRLSSAVLRAEIDPDGAQLSVLRDAAGRDLLWNGEPAFWKGRAPILFPIVGALDGGQYRRRGRRYALPRHGFARDRRFRVVRHDERAALFSLSADVRSLEVFPFRFELEIEFRLGGAALEIEARVHNTGDEPMPASVGFHPAFRWPLPFGAPRASHYLEFEHDEGAPIRRLDAHGLLTATRHETPVRGRRLVLADELFAADVMIFDELASRRLAYGADTGPRLEVDFPAATHLGIWTKPGAPFVCIEPWRGVADPAGFDRDFDDKPGVFVVAPGAQQSLAMRITVAEKTGSDSGV